MALQDDLQLIMDTGNQMANEISRIVVLAKEVLKLLELADAGEITFTAAQKTAKYQKYLDSKATLQTLYGNLPI